MKLLTKELEKKLPNLGETSDTGLSAYELTAVVKYFDPYSFWTWYGIEYDPDDRIFWGYVKGFENEFGEFSLDDLEQIYKFGRPRIERDLYFTPTKIKDLD